MKVRHILLGALFVLGCSSTTSPGALAGSWREDFGGIAGNALAFTLRTASDSVSGAGTWAGEACCSGSVTVSGTSSSGDVHLTFVFVTTGGLPAPPRTTIFDGRLLNSATLSGAFGAADGSTQAVTFRAAR